MIDRPLPFTLRQLQYALAVAEVRNFTRAALSCHVSQPSLSAQLLALEAALGVRLFDRDRGGVLPTPAGEEVLRRAKEALVAAQGVLESARVAEDPFAGTLRIGVLPTISPYSLPDIVPALRAAYPRLTVLWTEDKTAPLVSAVRDGDLDAALLALEADLGDLEREAVATDPFVLAVGAENPFAQSKAPLSLARLEGARLYLLEDGHCFREQALAVCTIARAQEPEFRATSLSTLAQMVAGGVGATLLPRLSLATENRRGELHIRRLRTSAARRTIGIVWRRGAALGPAMKQLAGVLRQAYTKIEPALRQSVSVSPGGGSRRKAPSSMRKR
jgi:LysR family hydrogen peroxide-inducible transcriptional activator